MIQRIDLKVGFQCNNCCKFCVQGDKRCRLPAKPKDELMRSLDDGRASGAQGVVFTGGEPTLHPDILALVRRAKELGFKNIQLQTNGRSFCYPGLVAKLAAAGANEFGPSLHGSKPQIHDFLTGAPGSFLQTVTGMKNIKKRGVRLITNSVVTKCNYRDLPALAELVVSLGVDQYQFAFMHVAGRAAENREWLTARKSIIEPWIKKGLDVGIKAGATVMTEAIPYCFMSGYEDHVAEKIIPSTKIYDADAVIEDFTKTRLEEGKAKGPRCPECRHFAVCEGPWREYPEMFGWDEFVPVSQASPTGRRAAVGAKREQSRKSGPSKRQGKALKLILAGVVSLAAAVGACAAEAGPPSERKADPALADAHCSGLAQAESRACRSVPESAMRIAKEHCHAAALEFQKGGYAGARDRWNWCLFYDPWNADAKAGLRRVEALDGKGPAKARGRPAAPPAAPKPGPGPAAPQPVAEKDRRASQQHYLSGVIYFQKGDYMKARDEWVLSRQLDPSNDDALAGLKRVEVLYGAKAVEPPSPPAKKAKQVPKKAPEPVSEDAKAALKRLDGTEKGGDGAQ
ncbi:MAG: radical SAM protein [Elusimicrobia bacterium]|nr:radical SAM protein [Elusimicrobiota bacterium]